MQPGVGFEAETHAFASLGFVFPAETNVFQRKKGLFSPGQTTVCFARVGTSTRKENPGSLKHFFFLAKGNVFAPKGFWNKLKHG